MVWLRRMLWGLGVALPALLIAALVLLVVSDVFARNLFAHSLRWAQELSVILLGALVWLGMVGASMQGQLFGITVFTDRLPPRLQRIALALRDLLVIVIALAVIRAAFAQVSTARFTTFLALGWPKWIMAVLLAAGMALLVLHHLVTLLAPSRKEQP